ncbi:MAG: amidohydrolase family protein [Elusimicrobiota bacterium]
MTNKPCRIIDVHAHYGKWFFPIYSDTPDNIFEIMNRNSIDKIVLSSTQAIVYNMVAGNAELAEILDKHSGFYGYIFLNPNYIDLSFKELEKYMGNHKKVLGLKLYSEGYIAQPLNCDGHKKFLTETQTRFPGTPVLFHCYSATAAMQLAGVAKQFPNLNFLMGHMGGAQWRSAVDCSIGIPNLYLEICSGNFDRGKLEYAVSKVGAGHILYGSDVTLINPAQMVGMVLDAEISENDRNLIFSKNATQLFRF